MRGRILVALFSMFLASGMVFADPAPKAASPETAAQLEKLGAIRLRVTAKLTDLMKLTNTSEDGVAAAGAALGTQYQLSTANWSKRVAQESAKPADTRDQAVIDAMNAKAEKAGVMWNAQGYKDGPLFSKQMTDIQNDATQINNLAATLTPVDQSWIRCDLDPALLTSVFTAIDKRIDEISAAATTLVENYKKLLAERENGLKD